MAAWIARSPACVTPELLPEYQLATSIPGVVPHLIQQKGMSAKALVDLLYRRSGVLGLSGISSVRALWSRYLLPRRPPRPRDNEKLTAGWARLPKWQDRGSCKEAGSPFRAIAEIF